MATTEAAGGAKIRNQGTGPTWRLHAVVEGKKQAKLAEDGDHGRTDIAEIGDQQQVAHHVEDHADDEGPGQKALLIDGDQHKLGHAVDESNGNAPDNHLQGQIRAAHDR